MSESAHVSRFIRPREAHKSLTQSLLDIVGQIPPPRVSPSENPKAHSRQLIRAAKLKASGTAGALALAPGPLGWLTIAPELIAVWKIQAQLVSDIAATYGRHSQLRREEMLYCLFQHTAAGAFKNIVIQVGQRFVVKRTPLSALYAIGNKISLRIAQRGITRVGTRWLPIAGALAVAGFVLLDTRKVAKTAQTLFSSDVIYEEDVIDVQPLSQSEKKKAAQSTKKRRST